MFGGYSFPGLFGLDKPVGDALIGSGNWVFLWKGGFALTHLGGIGKNAALGAPTAAFFLYMVAFMDTTATIPTGAMAERWKWKASSAGACSAARSTTRSSAPGRGAAAGWPSSATA